MADSEFICAAPKFPLPRRQPIDPTRCERCVMIGGLHAPMCPNHPFRAPTRHRCDVASKASPTCRHRKVFGDLVPVEQYSNGSDGRHHIGPVIISREGGYCVNTTTELEQ